MIDEHNLDYCMKFWCWSLYRTNRQFLIQRGTHLLLLAQPPHVKTVLFIYNVGFWFDIQFLCFCGRKMKCEIQGVKFFLFMISYGKWRIIEYMLYENNRHNGTLIKLPHLEPNSFKSRIFKKRAKHRWIALIFH